MNGEAHIDYALVTVDIDMPEDPDTLIAIPWGQINERVDAVLRVEGVDLGKRRLVIGLAVELIPVSAPWTELREARASVALDRDQTHSWSDS